MFSRLRTHLGTAGLVVAIVALVAALAGGAIAASSGGSDGSKATASAKAKKGPRGPRGPKGKPGATGPAGPQGAQGAQGPKGDAGAPGAPGAAGEKGATGATGANGTAGTPGATGATGAAGATGATGFSGFTATLPSGETEIGTWGGIFGFNKELWSPISFNIPLAAEIAGTNVKKVAVGGSAPECDDGAGEAGSAKNPEADPGFLCVFVAVDFLDSGLPDVFKGHQLAAGASTSGALVQKAGPTGSEGAPYYGTWAVTAP